VLRAGTVFKVDYKAGKARVRIGKKDDEDKLETDWLPWVSPRHSNVRVWNPPEVNEQVMVQCPGGHMNNAFIKMGVAFDKFPYEAQTKHVEKRTYRQKDEQKKYDMLVKFNRKSGQFRRRIKKMGKYHLGVGPDTEIAMIDGQIQLRVGKNMIQIDKDSIAAYIEKDKATFKMVAKSITAQVENKGIWKLTEDYFSAAIEEASYLLIKKETISLTLAQLQVGIQMSAGLLHAMVKTTEMKLKETFARLFGGSSAVTCDNAGVVMTSPKFDGIKGSAPPGSYDATKYDKPDKDKEPDAIEPPPADIGYAPYRPTS
jgi:phage baseplate assembly protein gpV